MRRSRLLLATTAAAALIFALCAPHSAHAQTFHVVRQDGAGHLNSSSDPRQIMVEDKCAPAKPCKPGLILPVWEPQDNISLGTQLFRAGVYLIAMCYLFLGVSIVADRFMAAIEVITSQEREVKMVRADGETSIVLVRIWNETVSNLTLMALGSSAPEILLSVIEICGNGFEAGDLGPGTIVGSAAFNFYVIIAVCIAAIPAGETRRIERNDVFWVTLVWSVFAYIWLYLILCVFSPNVVEVWEGVSTFVFFFLTVITSYIANRFTPVLQRRILGVNKRTLTHAHPQLSFRSRAHSDAQSAASGGGRADVRLRNDDKAEKALLAADLDDPERQAFNDHRQKFVHIFQQIRHENPDMPLRDIGRLVTYRTLADAPKSRAFRRMQATRQITAGRSLLTAAHLADAVMADDLVSSVQERADFAEISANATKVVFSFQPSHYICAEDVGRVKLSVKCERGERVDVPTIGYVHYHTVAGTATAGEDFIHTEGTLTFQPDETTKEINVGIVDNDVYEFDEEFFVRLSAPKAVNAAANATEAAPAALGAAKEALVIIVDDDHAGNFGFRSQVERVSENLGVFHLPVNRQRGARGKVIIPYAVVDGRAKRNADFRCNDGQLVFHDHQTSATIRIEIINDDRYEKSEEFYVQLGEPIWQEPTNRVQHPTDRANNNNTNTNNNNNNVAQKKAQAADGRPFLNENSRCKVIIKEDDELKGFVDRLVTHANCSLAVGTSSWKQQFQEALSPSGDCDEDVPLDVADGAVDSPPSEGKPSCSQLFMHYLSLPWKLIFAFIPPTDYLQGWICFMVSIVLIGVLTALIGDVAAMFGCTMGVKDSVTAISLVAMGTSVPDTFASKLAAVQDKTADASIGNVTGSNAVNVFLGIGVAWAMASIYHVYVAGDVFHVHAGSLATSLALFLFGCVVCTLMLQYRRFSKNIGAELGGPALSKWISVFLFGSMWVLYIVYNILDAYCIV